MKHNDTHKKSYLLTVAYDGTNYAGWQRQDNAVTVQERIEDALEVLLNRQVRVTAAGRTDAGVHALGQRIVFREDDLKVPLDKLPMVLNGLLPTDISVSFAESVREDFNPRFDAISKTYNYRIYSASCPNPLLGRYSAFVPGEMDILAMNDAADHFIGRHDYAAFCATGSSVKTTVREIYSLEVGTANPPDLFQRCTNQPKISQTDNLIDITVTGNAFLYNMVRIIAGTLMYVGIGKIKSREISNIILSKDRKKAGKTMPPQGLTLLGVSYR